MRRSQTQLFDRYDGDEIEITQPDRRMGKAGVAKPRAMCSNRLRNKDVFECCAFAADLEFTVGVPALVLVVQVNEQFFHVRILVEDLFRQQQQPTRQQARSNPADHFVPGTNFQELQCVVHDSHGRIGNSCLANITELQPDRSPTRMGGIVSCDDRLAALNHGRGIIDGNDLAAWHANALAHGQCCRAKGASEVITVTVGLDIASGERPYRLDRGGVARNGTAQHIRKDTRDRRVEAEGCITSIVGGVNLVLFHGLTVYRCGTIPPAMLRELHDELGIPADYGSDVELPVYAEASDLVEVGPNLVGRMQKLTPEAARRWQAMVTAANTIGIQLLIVSGFRGLEYQAGLIRSKLAAGQSIAEILAVNTAPGFSEHHTGRAVDIATPGSRPLTEEFEHSDAFRWLESRAIEFGFSMTYPRENPWGITYEPWHWSLKES